MNLPGWVVPLAVVAACLTFLVVTGLKQFRAQPAQWDSTYQQQERGKP